MSDQLFWEDVSEGSKLPALSKKPSKMQVVMWAGAVDQYGEQHYDKDYAVGMGLPGVIIHGSMKGAFLMQLFTDCLGLQGRLVRISWRDRQINLPGKTITCKAMVTKKYIEDEEGYVDCEIWTENEEGQRTTEGQATISLPRR